MVLTGYTKHIFRPKCNPGFTSVHCIAHLNEDVSEVLPYLNAVLGGTQYFRDPPEVMFHHQGKIIKVGAKRNRHQRPPRRGRSRSHPGMAKK